MADPTKNIKNCWSKYKKYGKAFIDPELQIQDVNKFELFQVYKDFLQAVKDDLRIK